MNPVFGSPDRVVKPALPYRAFLIRKIGESRTGLPLTRIGGDRASYRTFFYPSDAPLTKKKGRCNALSPLQPHQNRPNIFFLEQPFAPLHPFGNLHPPQRPLDDSPTMSHAARMRGISW
jgi:hypothetical protein